jgi:hypothetical protein
MTRARKIRGRVIGRRRGVAASVATSERGVPTTTIDRFMYSLKRIAADIYVADGCEDSMVVGCSLLRFVHSLTRPGSFKLNQIQMSRTTSSSHLFY